MKGLILNQTALCGSEYLVAMMIDLLLESLTYHECGLSSASCTFSFFGLQHLSVTKVARPKLTNGYSDRADNTDRT